MSIMPWLRLHNQPPFQFINILDVYWVSRLLNGRMYLIVNWAEVWAVWRLKFYIAV